MLKYFQVIALLDAGNRDNNASQENKTNEFYSIFIHKSIAY